MYSRGVHHTGLTYVQPSHGLHRVCNVHKTEIGSFIHTQSITCKEYIYCMFLYKLASHDKCQYAILNKEQKAITDSWRVSSLLLTCEDDPARTRTHARAGTPFFPHLFCLQISPPCVSLTCSERRSCRLLVQSSTPRCQSTSPAAAGAHSPRRGSRCCRV